MYVCMYVYVYIYVYVTCTQTESREEYVQLILLPAIYYKLFTDFATSYFLEVLLAYIKEHTHTHIPDL
jgi:hypothetical protein